MPCVDALLNKIKQREPEAQKCTSCQLNLTVPLFNVARRPRPAPQFEPTMSKPVAPDGADPNAPRNADAVPEIKGESAFGQFPYQCACIPLGRPNRNRSGMAFYCTGMPGRLQRAAELLHRIPMPDPHRTTRKRPRAQAQSRFPPPPPKGSRLSRHD